jgi:hypothetical protein
MISNDNGADSRASPGWTFDPVRSGQLALRRRKALKGSTAACTVIEHAIDAALMQAPIVRCLVTGSSEKTGPPLEPEGRRPGDDHLICV